MDIGGVDDWVKYYRSVSVQTLNEQSQLRQNGIMVGMSRADGLEIYLYPSVHFFF